MVGLDKQADLQNIFKLIISCFILELIEWKVWAPIPTKTCSLNIFFFSENEMSTTFADDDFCYLAVTTVMGSGQKTDGSIFPHFCHCSPFFSWLCNKSSTPTSQELCSTIFQSLSVNLWGISDWHTNQSPHFMQYFLTAQDISLKRNRFKQIHVRGYGRNCRS